MPTSESDTITRVPPQSLEAEQAVLGSMMIDKDACDIGLEMLHPDDFYRPAHQEVFRALGATIARNEPNDLIAIQEELRDRDQLANCGGTEYLMALIDTVPTAANIQYYSNIVRQKGLLRSLIHAGTRIVEIVHKEEGNREAEEILAAAENLILRIGERKSGDDIAELDDVYDEIYAKLPTMKTNYGAPICLPKLADACISMAYGEHIVIGARPMVGKSAFVWQLLTHAVRKDCPAAIFSLEMSKEQFVLRDLAGESGIHLWRMLSEEMDDNEYARVGSAANRAKGNRPIIVNAAGWTTAEIAACARRLVRKGVKIIAVDHIQLVSSSASSEHEQIKQISRDLQTLAARLNISVISLSQFNRNIERRGPDARPRLSDLMGSGAIEANADIIWMLWRKLNPEEQSSMGVTEAEIIVAKNRMLPSAVVKCGFLGRKFRFVERAAA